MTGEDRIITQPESGQGASVVIRYRHLAAATEPKRTQPDLAGAPRLPSCPARLAQIGVPSRSVTRGGSTRLKNGAKTIAFLVKRTTSIAHVLAAKGAVIARVNHHALPLFETDGCAFPMFRRFAMLRVGKPQEWPTFAGTKDKDSMAD